MCIIRIVEHLSITNKTWTKSFPVQKLPNLFPSSDLGPIGFSTCGHNGADGVARVGTTSHIGLGLTDLIGQVLCCRHIVLGYIEIKMPKAKSTLRVRKHRIIGEIISYIRSEDEGKLIHLIHYIKIMKPNPQIE